VRAVGVPCAARGVRVKQPGTLARRDQHDHLSIVTGPTGARARWRFLCRCLACLRAADGRRSLFRCRHRDSPVMRAVTIGANAGSVSTARSLRAGARTAHSPQRRTGTGWIDSCAEKFLSIDKTPQRRGEVQRATASRSSRARLRSTPQR
jgi:hypothetical protein